MPESLHWTAGLHHDGSALYVSNPLPRAGETVTIRLRAPLHAPITAAFMRTTPDGEHHYEPMTIVERDSVSAWWACSLPVTMPYNNYRFKLLTGQGAYYYNAVGVSRADYTDHNDFALLADFDGPAWVLDTVFYQIFPDRFYDGDPSLDVPEGAWQRHGYPTTRRKWGEIPQPFAEAGNVDFYGGDLPGIAQKLDYLADLGVNGIYLTPIFVSESNHRYDIRDFGNVDPYVGGNEGLADLRRALDRRSMRLMLDITPNHASFHHPWFTDAQADIQAPTAEYFTFNDHPHDYATWLGTRSLVKLDYGSQRLREAMYRAPDSALRRWLKAPYRIDAWRLDVQNMTARQGMAQLGNEVAREMRAAIKADNPDAYLIGEHFFDASSYLQGDQLDATMNYTGFTYPLRRWLAGNDLGAEWGKDYADTSLLPAEYMALQWARFMGAVPWVVARQQFNLLGSHDVVRIRRVLNHDRGLMRLAAAILLTSPGAPSIYYGDEIGMDGGHDPDNRRCMIWDEAEWDGELRAFYQKLINLRRSADALIHGGYQLLHADGGLLVYQRQSANQRLVIVGWRGPEDLERAAIPVWHGGLADGETLVDVLGGRTYTVAAGHITVESLARGDVLILEEP